MRAPWSHVLAYWCVAREAGEWQACRHQVLPDWEAARRRSLGDGVGPNGKRLDLKR